MVFPQLRWLVSCALLALLALVGCGGDAGTIAKSPSKYQSAGSNEKETPATTDKTDETNPPKNKQTPDVEETKPSTKTPDNETDPMPPEDPEDDGHPFPNRIAVKDLVKDDLFGKDAEWLNTSGSIRFDDLKGKFVIFDFWTYCCINCMHVLPELKKLEQKYPNELVVIGVHSAKFDTEKDAKNIAEAILRHEIEHPVVNDGDHRIWNSLGIRSWPTTIMIDPEGNIVSGKEGEVKAELYAKVLDLAIPFYEKRGTLNRKPVHFDLLAHRAEKTPLRYPGKILADEAGGRLFISDSNHNRIVIASLEGKLLDVIGNGAIGKQDGAYTEATFDHPQGCALVGETLYVADTENHLLREVDLKNKKVTTIAGTGKQGQSPWPGDDKVQAIEDIPERWVGKPMETALNSPWAIWPHKNSLYIAMAGPHQIWRMPTDKSEIGPYAGNAREDIVDGPLAPQGIDALRRELGFASFAQPSGLTSDGESLFVADSEGSSIRAVPFDPMKTVTTVVGSNELPDGRLFDFGDVDGAREVVKLQHPLDVAFHAGTIYVADTYNNKIKAIDAKTGVTKTFAGTGKPGKSDSEPSFDEPAGLAIAKGKLYVADTNNSLIRVIDIASGKVNTLTIEGLTPAVVKAVEKRPDFSTALIVKADKPLALKPVDGKVTVNVELALPEGWKINPLAPAAYYIDEPGDAKLIDAAALGKKTLDKPSEKYAIVLPVKAGQTSVHVSLSYYYCQKDEGSGLCKVGSVVFQQPLTIADDATESSATLTHVISEP